MSQPPRRRSVLRAAAAGFGWALWRPVAGAAQSTSGRGDPQAEQFVQTEAQKVISILADRGLSIAAKEAAFRRLIDQIADVPRITGFVLGKYARTITPAQRQQFNTTFREYAESVYQSHISDFRGQKLRVTGSVVRKPGDVVVNTVIYGGSDGGSQAVSWRVLINDGVCKVIDVQISGVWLAITQQQDFVSTIDNARGDINVLIAQLQAATRAQKQPRS